MNQKTKKELELEATILLRKSGFTWAGNIPTPELIENRINENYWKVPCGMSKKKPGIIGLKIRKN